MKRRIQLALMGCVLSVGAHFYLTLHYYPLKFGFASGNSICNLNAKFDCDAVSASSYSALFGIPLAAWGAVFYSILFLLILLSWLGWTDHPERMKRWSTLLAGVGAAASIGMAAISITLMHNYCIFCMVLYVLSFVVLWSVLGYSREAFWPNLKNDIPRLWSESRGILLALIAIPALAFFTHRIFSQNLGDAQIAKLVDGSVREWEATAPVTFVAKPALTAGPSGENARLVITEFADFLCGHCKRASFTLHAFVKAHPDVRFEFYSYPLDGACNETGRPPGNGNSCRLAAAVYCAEKEGKGWAMHDLIFDKQETMFNYNSAQEIDALLADQVAPLGLNWESVQRCLNQPETTDAIKAMAKQGNLVNIKGTPTIFANGKLLNRGQILPVLQTVYDRSPAKN